MEQDFDKDLPRLPGVGEVLAQYSRLEETTDRFSLNTSRVLAKMSWNENKTDIERVPASFIVVDKRASDETKCA